MSASGRGAWISTSSGREPSTGSGCRGPCSSMPGALPWKKTSKLSWTSIFPGRKRVVGGGPQLDELRRRYPKAVFTGPKFGEDLAEHYASADVFVFPSLTDTFGNVLLEALASGVPVAAYNVMGPKDVVANGSVGILGDDLREAALAALEIDRKECRSYAELFSWAACARRFSDIIAEANGVQHASQFRNETNDIAL